MLEAVKTQIEINQAQNKVLIESTINTTMTAFFAKQEEVHKTSELARLADKKDAHQQRLEQQLADAENIIQSKIAHETQMALETSQRDNTMKTMFHNFLTQMKQDFQQSITPTLPTVTPTKPQDSPGSKQRGKRSTSPGSPLRRAPSLRLQQSKDKLTMVIPIDSEEEMSKSPAAADHTEKPEKTEPKIREKPHTPTPPTLSVDEGTA